MNAPPALSEPRPIKLTVEAFGILSEAGAIERGRRVELVDGVMLEMSPQLRTHSFPKNEVAYRLRRVIEALDYRWKVQTEVTLALPPHDAPEPDIVLTDAPRGDGYVPAASVALVIEVADTSLRWDMEEKRRLYARAGVPEYWVIDVARCVLNRFWSPASGDYVERDRTPFAGELRSATLPALAIDGDGIL